MLISSTDIIENSNSENCDLLIATKEKLKPNSSNGR